MRPVIHRAEFILTNQWAMEFRHPDVRAAEGHILHVVLARLNGDVWEEAIAGQIKADGCADWGFGQPVMLHFCGPEDATILTLAYQEAAKVFAALVDSDY